MIETVMDADATRRAQADLDVDRHVSPARLAAFWGVSIDTVYRDIRKGALRAFRLPSGKIRVKMSDAKRYGRPIE